MKLCFAFNLSEAIPYLQQGGGGYSGEGYWPMKLVHVFGYDLDPLTPFQPQFSHIPRSRHGLPKIN